MKKTLISKLQLLESIRQHYGNHELTEPVLDFMTITSNFPTEAETSLGS